MNSREAFRLGMLIREGERYKNVLREYLDSGKSADVSIQQLAAWYREARSFLLSQGIDSPDDSDAFAMKVDWEGRVETPIRRSLSILKDIAGDTNDPNFQGSIFKPPPSISNSLRRFHARYPNPAKLGFIMMRFGRTPAHQRIVDGIRSALQPIGCTALRADDQQYSDDLLSNILTYIYGCGFGIAVFERIEQEDFNPNVSFEVGWMLGLQKQVCLLKDRTLKTLHTDLVGKLYRTFDPQDPVATIKVELERWVADVLSNG